MPLALRSKRPLRQRGLCRRRLFAGIIDSFLLVCVTKVQGITTSRVARVHNGGVARVHSRTVEKRRDWRLLPSPESTVGLERVTDGRLGASPESTPSPAPLRRHSQCP